jgi:hypothetical protein
MLSAKLKEAAGNSADATLYVDDVFSTWLYTGNGSTQTITNGIDLAGKGGMVWVKSRSAATDHKLTDTVRGATKALISNTTGAETTDSTGLTAFSSTGFSLGANSDYNTNAATYVSWTFRKAAKFFDVQTVTHTNGTANNIDLSVLGTVGMVIAKITTTTGDWTVWQRSLTASNNLKLNTTAAQSTTNAWLSVSGTTATLSASAPTGTYVIYGYAHDTSSTGFIQCGSYTGNGSATGPTVSLGWEPQYFMVKRAVGGTGIWLIMDSMRGMPVSGNDQLLYANASTAETGSLRVSPNATGFQIVDSDPDVNTSGNTYIYMAIRRPNKPPTTGTQVFGLNARTGTGANATVAGGQTDDAVLIKNLGAAVADLFSSRLTGTGYLVTSSTAAEVAAGATILQDNPWDVMDGVKVGTTSTITNASANTFINYLFKRAPGFFDEVCYKGNGDGSTITQNVNHNLGVVPELVIVKSRNTKPWPVYSTTTGTSNYLEVNTTTASTTQTDLWNGAPTSTILKLGVDSNGYVNNASLTYVAYLFATLAGISKVGSYTGNGTGQAIACGFGSGGARFVLIKRTDSTGNWYTFDSARGLTSGSSPYLLLNSTAAEVTGNNGVYASSGGFTLGATAITTTNIAAASYIFLAIA